jgi:tight adherence protein B
MTVLLPAVVAALGAVGVRAVLRLGDRAAIGLPPPARLRWFGVPGVVAAALADAGLDLDPAPLWTAWVVAAAAVVVVAPVAGAGTAVVVLAALAVVPSLAAAAFHGRADRLVDAALPSVLDGVARSLRSGATVAMALDEVAAEASGRLGSDLRRVVHRCRSGGSLADALAAWSAACPTPGVRLTAAALDLATDVGGTAAASIDGVASTLRVNLALAAEIRAQASQARYSALVIGLAPLAFGALAAGADHRTAHFLLRTTPGTLCLLVGLSLDAAGGWWMHRVTAVAA